MIIFDGSFLARPFQAKLSIRYLTSYNSSISLSCNPITSTPIRFNEINPSLDKVFKASRTGERLVPNSAAMPFSDRIFPGLMLPLIICRRSSQAMASPSELPCNQAVGYFILMTPILEERVF
ncbi:hypothetical protein D3C81_1717730 [compost metagenome]